MPELETQAKATQETPTPELLRAVTAAGFHNMHYKGGWEQEAQHSNFTLLGSAYRAVYHHRWSHFSLDWKTSGNYCSGTFFNEGRAAPEATSDSSTGV